MAEPVATAREFSFPKLESELKVLSGSIEDLSFQPFLAVCKEVECLLGKSVCVCARASSLAYVRGTG
jgi:hypothetical protein